jgi:ornithine cyclodeaminase
MLMLSRRDVEQLLDVEGLIDAVSIALADVSAGRASMPPRVAAWTSQRAGLLGLMGAYVPSLDSLVAKLVSLFPGNAGGPLPTHQALIASFDPKTGAPVAVLDGTAITAQRTAAASALATRLLAREDAAVLAIVGTGVQADSHLRYVSAVRRFREVRVAGRDPARAAQFAEAHAGVHACATVAEALAGADVVCATTHAREPVVRREWLARGAHVNSVGLHPEGGELDPEVMRGALVAVESRTSAFGAPPAGANELRFAVERGALRGPEDAVELGEIIARARPGRTSRDQLTVYKSVGIGAEDAAAAALVLRRARERGLGRTFEL